MAALTTPLAARVGLEAEVASIASFTGRRLTVSLAPRKAHAPSCPCCSRAVRAQASSASSTASASDGAMFASVSQSAAAPVPASSVIPAVLGAGVLAGAAAAFLSKTSAPAAAPIEYTNGAATRFSKKAAPAALATMAATFPNAMQEESFMKAVAAELSNLGFKRDNTIALVNTCRDEVCRPIVNLIDQEFGMSFNIAGLGGLVNCGKTGFKAAMSHSPVFPCDVDGKPRERYIFFGFPHVSVGESGEVGSLLRRGRGQPSSACGALIAIKGDISKGGELGMDENDPEYSLLRKKVASKLARTSGGPSLVQVTKAALQAITDDLENLISLTVDPATADYALITGVQIHSGNQIPGEPFRIERLCDYIAPNAMYAVIRGQKKILHCEVDQITTIKSVPAELIAA